MDLSLGVREKVILIVIVPPSPPSYDLPLGVREKVILIVLIVIDLPLGVREKVILIILFVVRIVGQVTEHDGETLHKVLQQLDCLRRI